MRALSYIWLAMLTSFPLLAAAANPCAPAPHAAGTPINAPHAAFEAYVVAVHVVKDPRSPFGAQLTRHALVEVIRSFHGPYSAGQQIETITVVGAHSCGGFVEEGGHVIVVSESGGPFEIIEALPKAQVAPQGPFAAIAYAAGEPHPREFKTSARNSVCCGRMNLASGARTPHRQRRRRDATFQDVSIEAALGQDERCSG
jgi:hypothetical protein